MKQKSINELFNQLKKLKNHPQRKVHGFLKIYFAWENAFYQHFKVLPHSKECKKIIETYGKNYPM